MKIVCCYDALNGQWPLRTATRIKRIEGAIFARSDNRPHSRIRQEHDSLVSSGRSTKIEMRKREGLRQGFGTSKCKGVLTRGTELHGLVLLIVPMRTCLFHRYNVRVWLNQRSKGRKKRKWLVQWRGSICIETKSLCSEWDGNGINASGNDCWTIKLVALPDRTFYWVMYFLIMQN